MLFLRIIGAVLFAGAIGCAIASSIVLSDMIGDINKVSSREDQENPLGFHLGKLLRINRKYREAYPDGVRSKLLNRLMVVASVLFLVGTELMFGFRFPVSLQAN
jgi:hypothetical protein